jgi:phage recombination protein Bet
MSDEEIEVQEISSATKWDTPEMIRTLKETVAKGATDAQFRMFLEVCRATGLNPFLKEIWYVPGVGVMAGRDGYLRKANEHPMFDGIETRVERDAQGVPIKAVCSVWRKDRAHPTTCEAYYDEYKKTGPTWNTYKSAMIAKVAEVLALKRSFSINGVVTEEEIGPQGSAEAREEVKQRKLQAIREAKQIEEALPPDQPFIERPGIEQRHAAEVQETEVALAETEGNPKPKRKRGDVSFKALAAFKEVKRELREVTGTDQIYYDTLQTAGVAHADELAHEPSKAVWKAMAAIVAKLRADKATREEFQAEASRLAGKMGFEGPKLYKETLASNGFDSLDQLIEEASSEQVTAILAELRAH